MSRRKSSLAFSLVLGSVAAAFPGCAWFHKTKPAPAPSTHKPGPRTPPRARESRPASKPADPQAQQRYYDLGLKYYAEEKYQEAKDAWQQAIQMGSQTPLADKSREYLKKTDQILKTLNEIEKK